MDLHGSLSIDIFGLIKTLKKEWNNHHEFLTWEYGKHHLKQSEIYRLHYCMFALGVNYKHSHQENSCIKCLTSFMFFKRKVIPFLNYVGENVSSSHKKEVATVMAAVSKLSYAVTRYASHRLHANVQFYAIEKIIQLMKTDQSVIYMILDHRQKNVDEISRGTS